MEADAALRASTYGGRHSRDARAIGQCLFPFPERLAEGVHGERLLYGVMADRLRLRVTATSHVFLIILGEQTFQIRLTR